MRTAVRAVFGDQAPNSLEAQRPILDMLSQKSEETHRYPLDEQLYDETRLYPYFHRYIAAHPSDFFLD